MTTDDLREETMPVTAHSIILYSISYAFKRGAISRFEHDAASELAVLYPALAHLVVNHANGPTNCDPVLEAKSLLEAMAKPTS